MLMRVLRLLSLLPIFLLQGIHVQSQGLPHVTLSIHADNKPLSEILREIEAQAGVKFSYNPRSIRADQLVTFHAGQSALREILVTLFEKVAVEYEIVEGQIVLGRQPEKIRRRESQSTFSGYVKDARTGEPLIGASVYIPAVQKGTATNAFGFFSLTLPPDAYTASVSYIGYQTSSRQVELQQSVQTTLSMEPSAPILETVEVQPMAGSIDEIRPGKVDLRPAQVEERPAYFGERDVVKTLESLPGVKLHSDGSTFYYVRGGERDQNLLLIDDAPVYNPSHLLGLFSSIIPDAVNDVTLYKGDMPANMGGRVSSILDVRTKKGNDQHFSAYGNVGLLSTRLGVEGPIRKNASSYLLSFRGSQFGWILNLLDAERTRFDFHDLTAKVNIRTGRNDRMYFSFYQGADNYFGSNNGIAWSNTATSLKWNHLVSNRMFLNATLAAGNYDYNLYSDVNNNTRWNSRIGNVDLKTDFSYFINPDQELTFGLSFNFYGFNPGNIQSNLPVGNLPALSVRNSFEQVLYASHQSKISEKISVNYGLRFSSWTNYGNAFEFVFNPQRQTIDTLFYGKGEAYKTYRNIEPRLSASYKLSSRGAIKISYARTVQNIHLISNSISPFTSLEVWLPSSINIRPQKSDQISLGYFHESRDQQLSISSEGYYKHLANQIDYTSHASTLLNPYLERELRFGEGNAYGVELTVTKSRGRFTGLTGYTYARVKRTFAEINDGKSFNAFHDRPHQANVMLNYHATTRTVLSTNFIYSTGAPYTSPISFFYFNGEQVPVYGQKNNSRFPDYHRLDVSASFRLNRNLVTRYQHSLTLSIYNLYGRKNYLFVNYNKSPQGEDFKIQSNAMVQDRTITQFYLFSVTPSITYNFKWR